MSDIPYCLLQCLCIVNLIDSASEMRLPPAPLSDTILHVSAFRGLQHTPLLEPQYLQNAATSYLFSLLLLQKHHTALTVPLFVSRYQKAHHPSTPGKVTKIQLDHQEAPLPIMIKSQPVCSIICLADVTSVLVSITDNRDVYRTLNIRDHYVPACPAAVETCSRVRP